MNITVHINLTNCLGCSILLIVQILKQKQYFKNDKRNNSILVAIYSIQWNKEQKITFELKFDQIKIER